MNSALLHPFADPTAPPSSFISIARADGAMVYDSDGKGYIDGLASLWYCQVGHNRPELIEAITDQLGRLDTYNTFAPFTNEPAERAAHAVAEISPMPDGRVFFGCSGSEAIDTALKIARLLPQANGDPDRQIIVRRSRGYHGTTFGGTSAQGIAANREGYGDLVPHFVEVDPDNIESLAGIFAEHGERIAAVISEPVQGAGGVFPPTDGYLDGVRRLCDDHGALLIADEVITGFGRTGSWFASQTYDVTPDMITFAKGVTSGYQPVSGVIVSRAVIERMNVPVLRHGYTYSGHPAGMAAVSANIEVLARESLVERAVHIGERLETGLRALADDGTIAGYRGVGALWAAELGEGADALAVRDRMIAAGVIPRGVNTWIAFCPPLVISDEQIDTMIDVLAQSV